MEEIEALIERPDSCEISVNQKGKWSGSIKVYANDIDTAMRNALRKANELSILIAEKNKEGGEWNM